MPGTNQRYVLPDWIENLSFEHALKLLLFGAFGQNAPTGTGVPVSPGGGSGVDNVNLTQVNGSTIALGSAAAAASLPVVLANGVARTLTSTAATGNGSVTAGALSVSFLTSTDFAGTVNGVTRSTSQAINIAVTYPGDTLPVIAYTISAGTLYIDKLT